MKNDDFRNLVMELFLKADGNTLTKDIALREDLIGLAMFDAPLIGVSSADDPIYDAFLDPKAIGPWYVKPSGWLTGAKTVVSLFFPFTEQVRTSNASEISFPSDEWLHARVEGQAFINSYMEQLRIQLEAKGVRACVPSSDDRFYSFNAGNAAKEYADISKDRFGSNWSERHAAYASGLGTFGLSKCLITERGCAGRFASIITDQVFEVNQRPYSDIYEYCLKCGKCAERCPVGAINIQEGKNLNTCFEQMRVLTKKYAPRYGCGLCYVSVPCEYKNPKG